MRRVLVLAALTGALLASAACGDSDDPNTATSPTAAPATSASVDVKANTTAACTAVDTLYGNLHTTAQPELAKAIMAITSGDSAAALKAWNTAKPLLAAAAATIKAEADKAADPAVKQALADLGAKYEKVASVTSPSQIEAVSGDLETASDNVKKICTDAGVTLKNFE
ncbi:MAG: hypothetical protein HOU81_14840 [Hamadaea sp.]|uniref:hypothetical protein n=1 Tax=Hamadaea sp. TaxID=2024425 RepID=UPI0017A4ADD5|nr:hypothetical protein [Hamadaea sp.]NUR72090.1 hypothetical protein [Hamadaea sp.]NUT22812.1 hypothetical protein [Hamadaea sp.]